MLPRQPLEAIRNRVKLDAEDLPALDHVMFLYLKLEHLLLLSLEELPSTFNGQETITQEDLSDLHGHKLQVQMFMPISTLEFNKLPVTK